MKTIGTFLVLMALTGVLSADDHIVIVFDTSGSMADYMRTAQKSRMMVAQDALVSVLSKVPDSTKVGILTFNGWVYDLQPVNRLNLEKAIRSTRPDGGTPLYEFISQGATRLLKERQEQGNAGSYKLLVVTDGEAGDSSLNRDSQFKDGGLRPGVLKDIMNRGITVDAIGLDMGSTHALASQINGVYMSGDDSASLTKAISKSVAEVGFGNAQDASNEAFREVAELPEGFVLASLKGLTTFANQPIGEKPPVEVTQPDGNVKLEANPANVEKVVGVGTIISVLMCGLGVAFFLIIIVARR